MLTCNIESEASTLVISIRAALAALPRNNLYLVFNLHLSHSLASQMGITAREQYRR